jgi:hypothetical protein
MATLGTMPLARVTRRLREGLRRRRELGSDADFDRVWPSFDEDLYGSSYGALRLSVVLDDLLESIPKLRSGGVSILDGLWVTLNLAPGRLRERSGILRA